MSSDWIRWLLDIDVIPKNAEGLRVAWEHPWAGWVWTWLLLAAAALAGWSYARLAGRRGARVVLAAARFLIIALVLVLISGPMLELPRETVERDWVLMLVDRSASMTIADVEAAPRRITREQQLRSLLDEHAAVWQDLAESRQVVWLGFHDGAFNLPALPVLSPEAEPISPVQLDDPTGQRTRLGSALEQAMQRAAARAVSGVARALEMMEPGSSQEGRLLSRLGLDLAAAGGGGAGGLELGATGGKARGPSRAGGGAFFHHRVGACAHQRSHARASARNGRARLGVDAR